MLETPWTQQNILAFHSTNEKDQPRDGQHQRHVIPKRGQRWWETTSGTHNAHSIATNQRSVEPRTREPRRPLQTTISNVTAQLRLRQRRTDRGTSSTPSRHGTRRGEQLSNTASTSRHLPPATHRLPPRCLLQQHTSSRTITKRVLGTAQRRLRRTNNKTTIAQKHAIKHVAGNRQQSTILVRITTRSTSNKARKPRRFPIIAQRALLLISRRTSHRRYVGPPQGTHNRHTTHPLLAKT